MTTEELGPELELPTELDRLAAALAAFQADLPAVGKTKTADTGTYSYKYADLADLSQIVLPALARHGLSFVSVPRGHVLHGILLHASGQYIAGELPIGGSSPQAIGSAVTYARRYLLSALTGVAADEDDDGRAASVKPARKAAASKKGDDAVEKPPAGGITSAQTRMLAVLMKKAGLPDRTSALAYVVETIGRDISSRNELTSQEASLVIDSLQRDTADMPEQGTGEG